MATTSKPQKPTYEELVATIQELQARIVELEAELAKARKNSETSSKPPSSDVVNPKPKNKKPGRPKKRKRGGNRGILGTNGRLLKNPKSISTLTTIWMVVRTAVGTLSWIMRSLASYNKSISRPLPLSSMSIARSVVGVSRAKKCITFRFRRMSGEPDWSALD